MIDRVDNPVYADRGEKQSTKDIRAGGGRAGRGGKSRRFVESLRAHPHCHPRPKTSENRGMSLFSTSSPALRLLRLPYNKLQPHLFPFLRALQTVRCASGRKKGTKKPFAQVLGKG